MDVKTALKQRGFDYRKPNNLPIIQNPIDYYDYHKRAIYKQENHADYPQFFEVLVKEIVTREFQFEAENNIKIIGEGSGGDYDVIAVDNANEMLYLECKSGKNITYNDFKNFYSRNLFLKPSLSIIVFDQSKKDVREYLNLMRAVLTDNAKKQDKTLATKADYRYPDFEVIPEVGKEFAYHMNRNLFFCSGENIVRAVTHCLRYYHGTVKQSSYWG